MLAYSFAVINENVKCQIDVVSVDLFGKSQKCRAFTLNRVYGIFNTITLIGHFFIKEAEGKKNLPACMALVLGCSVALRKRAEAHV